MRGPGAAQNPPILLTNDLVWQMRAASALEWRVACRRTFKKGLVSST